MRVIEIRRRFSPVYQCPLEDKEMEQTIIGLSVAVVIAVAVSLAIFIPILSTRGKKRFKKS